MKRKVFVFLLAAVFCINSMTVFAEGEDMEHEGSTETEEIKEPAQMPHTKEEESFDTSEALTSLKERLPEIGGGGEIKRKSFGQKKRLLLILKKS